MFCSLGFQLGCQAKDEGPPVAEPKTLSYQILAESPHDTRAFTQGLIFENGLFYESTGGRGASSIRMVHPQTGDILRGGLLEKEFFGEGVTLMNDKIYQLTWESEVGFIYNRNTLEKTGQFKYSGQGWGLTNDGKHLIMSNGSAELQFLNPATFAVERTLTVRNHKGPVEIINELQFVDGYIYSNVWHSDDILKIDASNGHVMGVLDCSALGQPRPKNPEAVLNGIAYDTKSKHFYLTGKLWNKVYKVKISE